VLECANVRFEVVPVLPNAARLEAELATRSQDDQGVTSQHRRERPGVFAGVRLDSTPEDA